MLPRFTPMVNMKRLKSRWFRQNKAKNSAEMLKMYVGSSDLHRRTPRTRLAQGYCCRRFCMYVWFLCPLDILFYAKGRFCAVEAFFVCGDGKSPVAGVSTSSASLSAGASVASVVGAAVCALFTVSASATVLFTVIGSLRILRDEDAVGAAVAIESAETAAWLPGALPGCCAGVDSGLFRGPGYAQAYLILFVHSKREAARLPFFLPYFMQGGVFLCHAVFLTCGGTAACIRLLHARRCGGAKSTGPGRCAFAALRCFAWLPG